MGTPQLSLTIVSALYSAPMPGGKLFGSSKESSHGDGPTPTSLQYPWFSASASLSVAFRTRASRRKLIPSAPSNSDCVMGPYADAPAVRGSGTIKNVLGFLV